MKRKFLLPLLSLPLLLSSCSLLFGEEQSYMIESVTSVVDQEGNTKVTIAFREDAREDFVFTIPSGTTGIDGSTIKDVTAKIEGEEIVLTIKVEGKEDVTLRVPNLEGEDGRLITRLTIGKDTDGNTTLTFLYSDGTESALLTLPKGEDGESASRLISSFEVEKEEDGTKVTIHYQDQSEDTVFVIPDAKDGTTIEKVEITKVTSASTTYTFYLSDGSTIDIDLPVTRAQSWLQGVGEPSSSLGEDADFYLDIRSGDFYAKEEGKWKFLLTIDGYQTEENPSYYSLTFDAQGGTLNTGFGSVTYFLEEGSRLPLEILTERIGTPTRGDDIFLGWYTSPDYDPNAGRFSDTTPVLRDLMLYAWYDIA